MSSRRITPAAYTEICVYDHGLFTNGWETVRVIKFEIRLWTTLTG